MPLRGNGMNTDFLVVLPGVVVWIPAFAGMT
jgi:hypothetical protein